MSQNASVAQSSAVRGVPAASWRPGGLLMDLPHQHCSLAARAFPPLARRRRLGPAGVEIPKD
eukprot:7586681-Pyramimonas_sp.AAC.1